MSAPATAPREASGNSLSRRGTPFEDTVDPLSLGGPSRAPAASVGRRLRSHWPHHALSGQSAKACWGGSPRIRPWRIRALRFGSNTAWPIRTRMESRSNGSPPWWNAKRARLGGSCAPTRSAVRFYFLSPADRWQAASQRSLCQVSQIGRHDLQGDRGYQV